MTPRDIVAAYLSPPYNFSLAMWPDAGDAKGPREADWPRKPKALDDWTPGSRVGIMTGTEVAQGRWLHDIDIDWQPGAGVAMALLPPTGFAYGRPSKRVSHCFYTCSEALRSIRFEDVDKTCLIELRGTKADGSVGLQSMAPPSTWSKGAQREPLTFVRHEPPSHVEAALLLSRVALAAVGMLLAKHFGHNGFGHDVRLAWAGHLLRAGVAQDDLIAMGEALSVACNNKELHDVRRVVESTAAALATDGKKVKGRTALAAIIGKPAILRIDEWLGRDADFARGRDGQILARHAGNICRAVELLGHTLTHDQFSDKLLLDGVPMQDRQVNRLLLDVEREHRFQPPDQYFRMVIEDAAWTHGFHPVKDYLATLAWDGVPRIDTWLIDAGGAPDSPYVRAVSAIMLIAAVRRVLTPGCKYDEMVVLEGTQGAGKSSAVQALCPNPDWFTDDLPLNLKSQQVIEATLGKWLVEASDLAGKRKTEVEGLKAMLSRQVDGPARLAYARIPVERPRHFIIVGTTNSSTYLTDPTGARRFWPIPVVQFDVPWITSVRDQLWAEALRRAEAGASIRLPEDLWPEATAAQNRRREVDPWEPLLHNALLKLVPSSDARRRITTDELWQAVGVEPAFRDRSGQLRISDVMQRLGFERTRVRGSDGGVHVGYRQAVPGDLPLDDGGIAVEEDDDVTVGQPDGVPF